MWQRRVIYALLVMGVLWCSVSVALAAQMTVIPTLGFGVVDRTFIEQQGTILLTAIIGFLSTMAALLFQIYRERRNRQWDLEDRRHARDEQKIQAAQIAADLTNEQARSRFAMGMLERMLVRKIDENTSLTKESAAASIEALNAANNFNNKLGSIIGIQQTVAETQDTVEAVADTVDAVADTTAQIHRDLSK